MHIAGIRTPEEWAHFHAINRQVIVLEGLMRIDHMVEAIIHKHVKAFLVESIMLQARWPHDYTDQAIANAMIGGIGIARINAEMLNGRFYSEE